MPSSLGMDGLMILGENVLQQSNLVYCSTLASCTVFRISNLLDFTYSPPPVRRMFSDDIVGLAQVQSQCIEETGWWISQHRHNFAGNL